MGFPPRLNGKSTPLPADHRAICPNCGRVFLEYGVAETNKKVKLQCPYCDHKFVTKMVQENSNLKK